MLSDVIYTRSRLHIVGSHIALLLTDINCASIMAALAEATTLRTRSSVPNVDVLGNSIGLQAALGLHRGKQGVRHIFTDNTASATDNTRTCLDVRACDDTTVIVYMILSTSSEVQVDVVVVILVHGGVQRS